MPAATTGLFFNVNGKDVVEENVDPELTLAYYLRNKLGLRGTKLGCEEGVCGSCTVVLGTWDEQQNKASYVAVNACLVPLFQVHRSFVITVEGVGSRDKIHPIQDRLAKGHALQCGFCTPGFVMSAYALLRTHPNPTTDQINSAIRANLCRCTGYRPILEALYSFSPQQTGGCCGGNKSGGGCCKEVKSEEDEGYDEKLLTFQDFPKYDPTQEIIFPPSLRNFPESEEQVNLIGARVELAMPKTLEQFKSAKKNADNIISSGLITRLITARKPESFTKKWVTTKFVREFNVINVTQHTVTIGSALSIQKLSYLLLLSLHPNIGSSVSEFISKFSSLQVANFATWAGAIASAAQSSNSVSDLLLLLTVLDANLTLLSENGETMQVSVNEFAEKKLYSTKTIVNAIFNRTDNRRLFCLKLGETSEKDSTKFNFGALIGNGSSRVFVGIGGIPKSLPQVGAALDDSQKLDVQSLVQQSEICQPTQLTVALNRLSEFLSYPNSQKVSEPVNYLQYFKPSENESVGRPIASYFSERAVTGEALYVNDIKTHEAVHLGFVLSTVPCAEIVGVDATEAMRVEGVVGYFGIDDVPGNNKPGLTLANMNLPDDTTVFADKKVESVGQVIGVIAANDVVLARRAAKLVKVEYRMLASLVDFKEAIEKGPLHGDSQHFGRSAEDVESSIARAEKVFEGEAYIGGQEHFYMETQSSLVIPGEGDELVVHCSTQGTSFTQLVVAEVLGLPAHKIIVKTKRLGGGFGGKVNNASWIACMSAIVARKLNRPVYGLLSREDDLVVTGKRHAVYAKYRVGYDAEGKVQGVHYKAWLNGGWSKDHSEGVTMVMGLKIDDVYNMRSVRFDGYPVKTNSCSNTALRGYGNPQGKLINEGIMRRIAYETKKNVEEVKRMNFAVEGDQNYLGGTIHSDALVECWEYCVKWSKFEQRKKQVETFNRSSKTVKRGIAMSSVRFGLPHPGPTGHGIASLLINLDGSVQLSIGGTEMGQGLNQKMLQVCSESLKRPIDTITIVDCSTDKVTNAPETGGSQNADTNGLAVLACCQRILSRLEPLIEKNNGDWNAAVRDAFKSFVPLQCTEYGVVERQKYGVRESESPYNTTGACAVEVEVDTLTGYNKVIRVDMVMDVGESLNPALDIGQIEGAFMQGYGLVTCEKITFNKETGVLEQNSASKYKVPKVEDVPRDFRVKLLGINKVNGAQVYSSKGIGEPPLMMSCGAVHSAIMDSIDSWRKENGMDEFVETVSPLSAEKILELCSRH